MNRNKSAGLYLGLLMILFGIVFLLDLNGLLPRSFFSEYINIILAVVIFMMYLKSKKLYALIVASFFFFNGLLLIFDGFIRGYNYWSGIFLIPGLMFLVVFIARKSIAWLIPGALLTCWGTYLFLITASVITGFTTIIGMFFIFTGLAFLMVFFYEHASWAAIPSVVLGGFGVVVATIGLGPIARNLLFQVIALAIIVIGVALIIQHMLHQRKNSAFNSSIEDDEEDD